MNNDQLFEEFSMIKKAKKKFRVRKAKIVISD